MLERVSMGRQAVGNGEQLFLDHARVVCLLLAANTVSSGIMPCQQTRYLSSMRRAGLGGVGGEPVPDAPN